MPDVGSQLRIYYDRLVRPTDAEDVIAGRAERDTATLEARPAPPGSWWRKPAVVVSMAGLATVLLIGGAAVMLFRRGGDGGVASTAAPTASSTHVAETAPDNTAAATTTAAPATTQAPSTTAPPTSVVAPAPNMGVVSLDPEATLQFGQPTPGFDSEGRPQVVYARSQGSTALASCEDEECSSVIIREVFSAGLRVGTPRPDAGPVFWVGGGSDLHPEAMLVVCPDRGCSDPTFHLQIPERSTVPAITTDDSGTTLVVYHNWWAEPPTITVKRCTGSSCTIDATEWVAWELPADLWISGVGAAINDTGLPVIAFRTAEGIMIGRCAEPDCMPSPEGSGIQRLADIPIADVVRDPLFALGNGATPVTVLSVNRTPADSQTWVGEAIVVAACVDADCSDWVVTEMAEVTDMYSEWAMATGPDGLVRMAWTEHDSTFLATCHNTICSEFSIVDTGHPADDVGLSFDPHGAPVLATMSQQRGLELVFCGDDSCQIGN